MAAEALLLVAGGVVAGAIGAAGGITSLVSYPTLLLVGVPPLPATVANLVAGAVCWPGSALTSRRELRGTSRTLRRNLPAAVAGAAAGAGLLLSTSPELFARIVPFLVLAASVALLAQPHIDAFFAHERINPAVSLLLIGAVSVYGGYFGSGSGIMLLALALTLFDTRFPQANALKNMLIGAVSVTSAALFILASTVDWIVVLPLALGLFIGSIIGPTIARRVPPVTARWTIGILGTAFAVSLWLRT